MPLGGHHENYSSTRRVIDGAETNNVAET
jgi:hypothetical protein